MTQLLYSVIVLLCMVVVSLLVKFYYVWKEGRDEEHAIGLQKTDWEEHEDRGRELAQAGQETSDGLEQ